MDFEAPVLDLTDQSGPSRVVRPKTPDRSDTFSFAVTAANDDGAVPELSPERTLEVLEERRVNEIKRIQYAMTAFRMLLVPYTILQVYSYYLPYPTSALRLAVSVIALLLVHIPSVLWIVDRAKTKREAERAAVWALVADGIALSMMVVAYTFDQNTAVWAILYVLPLEAALLFQLKGAITAWSGITVLYLVRDVVGAAVYEYGFYPQSVSFRMGVGLVLAVIVGISARDLVRERNRLSVLTRSLEHHGEELRMANERLLRAQRSQMDFVAVTNHELRTPLTAINGFSRTLTVRWNSMNDESRRAAVEAIGLQAARLNELVEDILTVSAIHAGGLSIHVVPMRLKPAIQRAVDRANIDVSVDCSETLTVVADRARVTQIITNLLTNAAKYGEAPYDVSAKSVTGGKAEIVVRDSGEGVPLSFQETMWDEFTQASVGVSRTSIGHGLGLSIVKNLAESQGGTVRYRDAENGGAVFTVTLPTKADTSNRSADVENVVDLTGM